jgi:hypothetical protein
LRFVDIGLRGFGQVMSQARWPMSSAQPVLLAPVGVHLLAAARALVDQHGQGLEPLDVDEAGLTVAVLDLHRPRARVEQVEILRLRAAPSASQIEDQRVSVLDRTLAIRSSSADCILRLA